MMGTYLLVILLNKEMFLDIDVVGETGETVKMSDLGSFEELMDAILNYRENREVVSKIQEHWYNDAIKHIELNEIKLEAFTRTISPCLWEPFRSDMFKMSNLLEWEGKEFYGYRREHIPEFLDMLHETKRYLEERNEIPYHNSSIGYFIGKIEDAIENGFSDYMFLWKN